MDEREVAKQIEGLGRELAGLELVLVREGLGIPTLSRQIRARVRILEREVGLHGEEQRPIGAEKTIRCGGCLRWAYASEGLRECWICRVGRWLEGRFRRETHSPLKPKDETER